ncbi:MFS general substrate transporter [Calocera cornea HHB12733]|uniref:MFS general substrate transporter n=1 Tax=Calocera cornea HHB12733 TaxID=1353952 RepID=A0A165DR26_9BASI|nr:MFS general substrate transporter [Calocera cornea HHB12733]
MAPSSSRSSGTVARPLTSHVGGSEMHSLDADPDPSTELGGEKQQAHSAGLDAPDSRRDCNGEAGIIEIEVDEGQGKVDIEHVLVVNDPRQWSRSRKKLVLALIALASVAPTLAASIYNPAFNQIQAELGATDAEIALSLSLYIWVQGNAPLVWSAISEIKGRKPVYLASLTLFTVGCIVAAEARSIGVLIGMRILQAAGTSAVLSIGAGTLADIFEPRERGSMMGVYYAAGLLGPSLGPLLGGALTSGLGWRSTFWFLVIFAGCTLVLFIFFKDTFRKERSLAYRSAVNRAAARARAKNGGAAIIQAGRVVTRGGDSEEIKLSLRDVNPITPAWRILQRVNILTIMFGSALLFAFVYSTSYTAAITFARPPYNYDSMYIGLVLLSFGLGNVLGSILGGRWSDCSLARLKAQNGGVSAPEMRIHSMHVVMPLLPLSALAYAWTAQEKVHIAGPVVCLFVSGFSTMWIYSSTLAYLVDANTGRSSTAIAVNSSFRGTAGFIAAEVAIPLQNAIGDGGLYTLWAGMTALTVALLLVTERWGGQWREKAVEKEERRWEEKQRRVEAQ